MMRLLTILFLVNICLLGQGLQAQEDHAKMSSEQTSNHATPAVPAVSATQTDWAIIEIVALDLMKNKEFVRNFGPVPKGQKIPRRLWIRSETLPYVKLILEATNADYNYLRDQRGPKDAFDIVDSIRDNLVDRNQTPVSLAGFQPKNPTLLIDPTGKEVPVRTSLDFRFDHPNTGFLSVWLPGFSVNGNKAILRFGAGPSAHGIDGTYMLTKKGNGWKIKWHYVRSRF